MRIMTEKSVIANVFDEIESQDQEIIDIWGSKYLPIQWQNALGQWEAPLEHWGGSMLEFEYDISQVKHQANMVDGFLMDSINIAPFAYKMHWGYEDEAGEYHIAEEPDWTVSDAWRSRVHILALMKEAQDMTPVMLTAGSNTGKHLLANVRQGQRRIANMLKRIDRPDVPPHLFWMEMIAGKPVTVGKGEASQIICPPVAAAPPNMRKMTPKAIAKFLTDNYVGHDIRDLFSDGLLEEGQEWSVKQPERLQLDDGSNGGALPPASVEAVVLIDGTLHLPDLHEASQEDMKKCGMSTGLFNHDNHVERAFNKVINEGNLVRAPRAAQWSAWSEELLTRWNDKKALEKSQKIEEEI
jgi:hypothetical protein